MIPAVATFGCTEMFCRRYEFGREVNPAARRAVLVSGRRAGPVVAPGGCEDRPRDTFTRRLAHERLGLVAQSVANRVGRGRCEGLHLRSQEPGNGYPLSPVEDRERLRSVSR